jgi:hypothetical protein
MDGFLTLITLTVLRLVVPFGLVLALGTWLQRAQAAHRER